MEHLRASEELTEYVDGALGAAERRDLGEHLAGCEDCRSWVAAYRLLSGALGASVSPATSTLESDLRPAHLSPGHLSSTELSRFALGQTLDTPTQQRCSQHLETCLECGQEVSLVRAAAAEAREGRVLELSPSLAAPSSKMASKMTSFSRLAWAAGLLLVVGVVMFGRSTPDSTASRLLSDATVSELTAVGSPDSILVETTRIEPGGELNINAGNSVAFGDGFSVESGGTLSVVLDQSYDS